MNDHGYSYNISMTVFSIISISIIGYPVVSVLMDSEPWIRNLIFMLYGALIFYVMSMLTPKKPKRIEWEAKH